MRKVLDPDSEVEGHISPFDELIDLAKTTKDAIEAMNNEVVEDDDNYEDYDDLPRHYYGEEGEVLFYDD